jgi:hypothetical protein
MARNTFDDTTKQLFEKIQATIKVIDGKLMNPNCVNKEELKKKKIALKQAVKKLKSAYYSKAESKIIENADSLLTSISTYDVNKIYKVE